MKFKPAITIVDDRIKEGINQLDENRYEVIFPRRTQRKFRNFGNWTEQHDIAEWLDDNVPAGELMSFKPISLGSQKVWVVHVPRFTTATLMWLRWCDGWRP